MASSSQQLLSLTNLTITCYLPAIWPANSNIFVDFSSNKTENDLCNKPTLLDSHITVIAASLTNITGVILNQGGQVKEVEYDVLGSTLTIKNTTDRSQMLALINFTIVDFQNPSYIDRSRMAVEMEVRSQDNQVIFDTSTPAFIPLEPGKIRGFAYSSVSSIANHQTTITLTYDLATTLQIGTNNPPNNF